MADSKRLPDGVYCGAHVIPSDMVDKMAAVSPVRAIASITF